jgi:hypothetical protein
MQARRGEGRAVEMCEEGETDIMPKEEKGRGGGEDEEEHKAHMCRLPFVPALLMQLLMPVKPDLLDFIPQK